MWICMAAASMFSRASVPSLAWSRSSQVQSVKVLAPFLHTPRSKHARSMRSAQPPPFPYDGTNLAYTSAPQPSRY